MVTVESMKKVLKEEYGISNLKELEDAMRNMKKINIGIFTMNKKNTTIKEMKQEAKAK